MKFAILFTFLPLVLGLSEPGVWKDVKMDQGVVCFRVQWNALPESVVSLQDLEAFKVTKTRYSLFKKIMYKDTKISVQISCKQNTALKIGWLLRHSPCASEYFIEQGDPQTQQELQTYFDFPDHQLLPDLNYKKITYVKSNVTEEACEHGIIVLPDLSKVKPVEVDVIMPVNKSAVTGDIKSEEKKSEDNPAGKPDDAKAKKKAEKGDAGTRKKRAAEETGKGKTESPTSTTQFDQSTMLAPSASPNEGTDDIDHSDVAKTWSDGNYGFFLFVEGDTIMDDNFEVEVTVRMHGKYGYISAHEWPLLIFYGVMGLMYLFLGITWLVMLACNWRDLLRVQFWVGGVIVLGMVEKAVFYAEYQSVANSGCSVTRGAIIFAEVVSSLKRALARMLVIIVSIGFGIVKPRLGPTLHKVLFVGGLYFILGSIEGSMRALQPMGDRSTESMLAAVPLAVVDASICWWIFSCLIQTTRQLRLRRNIVKLTLYRHFTNTLIFAVLASVIFMIWSLIQVKTKTCLTDWQELWVDEAFWHLLFSVILIVIMILWRPSSNNQRYAFSPLLDAADDEDEDDETVLNDAFDGMKMRSKVQANGSPKAKERNSIEDDLKWVEDNIPSSVTDKALPGLLDSDEEIMTAKYEMSKMQ